MQLLRTIGIILIVYYGFKLLAKYVFPFLLKRWVNKKMGQFQNQGANQFNERQKAQEFAKQQEGKVKIKSKPNGNRTETEGIGDFVDYEEVE